MPLLLTQPESNFGPFLSNFNWQQRPLPGPRRPGPPVTSHGTQARRPQTRQLPGGLGNAKGDLQDAF